MLSARVSQLGTSGGVQAGYDRGEADLALHGCPLIQVSSERVNRVRAGTARLALGLGQRARRGGAARGEAQRGTKGTEACRWTGAAGSGGGMSLGRMGWSYDSERQRDASCAAIRHPENHGAVPDSERADTCGYVKNRVSKRPSCAPGSRLRSSRVPPQPGPYPKFAQTISFGLCEKNCYFPEKIKNVVKFAASSHHWGTAGWGA